MKIGFFGLLTLIFVTLKLTGYIDWSWWFVLMPSISVALVWLLIFVLIVWLDTKDPLWRYRK